MMLRGKTLWIKLITGELGYVSYIYFAQLWNRKENIDLYDLKQFFHSHMYTSEGTSRGVFAKITKFGRGCNDQIVEAWGGGYRENIRTEGSLVLSKKLQQSGHAILYSHDNV